MANKIVSLRVFKEEYQKSFISWLTGSFKSEDNEKVLTIYGIKEEVATDIQSLMFKSESECKALFPQFRTIEDERKAYQDAVRAALNMVRDATCKLFTSDAYKALSDEDRAQLHADENIDAVSEFTIQQLKWNA